MFPLLYLILPVLIPVLGILWLVCKVRHSRWTTFIGVAFVMVLLMQTLQVLPVTVVTIIGIWRLIVWGVGRKDTLARSRLKAEVPEARPRGLVESVDND